ncbi:hypothetical protein P152DRAFT_469291 [Eremomyces bilateralis CBS 781.70]|uniref:DNA2/NAM7 helicase-like C-terminal domain-containing protein n=1 Tax=Eremomyces bilateralis CBS 781.70 TaxID=1392243 RepID=A0A6G1FQA4_9PEZI|nr:uncharacterized protein P152DRAFT_469291 [Eremomyces bilateralis CBS 781.70]KAF1807832.1 hypothetical protein P152DRAFT_469291 [Eremomyces bilateralis CBS 781.70]
MFGRNITESAHGHQEARARVREAQLIFTTCTGSGLGLLRSEKFDIVLIDKASQQTQPESLIPLTKGCQRAVFVGDHAQFHATVQKHAVVADFDTSLFEKHYNMPDIPGVAKSNPTRKPMEIVIVTPYTRQMQILKRTLPSSKVLCIDGYQDWMADIVVFVSVRCNVHFDIGYLQDKKLLNMALTRAKSGIIFIGDRLTLTGMSEGTPETEIKAIWARLLKSCAQLQLQTDTS